MNKKSLEALILSGAMDFFGERATLLANIENMTRASRQQEKKQESSQIGLFDFAGNSESYDDRFQLESVSEMSYEKKLFGEKEVL